MYRVWIEEILGFKLRGTRLTIDPVIPRSWEGFKLTFRYGRAEYAIHVENPTPINRGVLWVELDGQRHPDSTISLVDDEQRACGNRHAGNT